MLNYTIEDRIKIKKNYKTLYHKWCCPYSLWIDFCEYMSPIEYNVWNEIRSNWLKFYPQYPVLNYFLDFADPINKIWIEVDWKEWHLDKEKDMKRQKIIENEWWKIYRINWKDTFVDIYKQEMDEYDWDWFVIETEWEKQNKIYWIRFYRYLIENLRIQTRQNIEWEKMIDKENKQNENRNNIFKQIQFLKNRLLNFWRSRFR